MIRLFIFLLLMLSDGTLSGNTVLKGIVRDAETHEPLPNANIYIKDTYIGTISNSHGQYQLEIPQIPSEIIVSFIGYETRTIRIEEYGVRELNISLKPVAIKLQSVIVYADQEDPAAGIMRKVIAKKIDRKRKLRSYRAKAYTRMNVENEEIRTLTWRQWTNHFPHSPG